MSVWNRIQRFVEYPIYKCKKLSAFIIDETVIQIGNQHFWLWIGIEPADKTILGIYISEELCLLRKIKSLVEKLWKTYNLHRGWNMV